MFGKVGRYQFLSTDGAVHSRRQPHLFVDLNQVPNGKRQLIIFTLLVAVDDLTSPVLRGRFVSGEWSDKEQLVNLLWQWMPPTSGGESGEFSAVSKSFCVNFLLDKR